jgi:hypothetical protein
MTSAFSVLSLKRNRSTNKPFSSSTTTEPVTKLSKLKSGFSTLSKKLLSDHHHDSGSTTKRISSCFLMIGLFQYLRSNEDHQIKSSKSSTSTTELKRKATFDSDRNYEYNQYHSRKNFVEEERNMHTLPIASSPSKLTSILIKRSCTNPTTSYRQVIQQHQQAATVDKANSTISARRKRTWSNATVSNMTINSEDLTAKEFADIAGIRILPEDEDYVETEEQQMRRYNDQDESEEDFIVHTVSSRYTTQNHHERSSLISYASLTSHSTTSKLKIWDSEFWLNPEEVTASRSNSTSKKDAIEGPAVVAVTTELSRKPSATLTAKKLVIIDNEPPILHELRRINSEKKNDHCVIKKGRFEIQLGTVAVLLDNNDNDKPFGNANDVAVEEISSRSPVLIINDSNITVSAS